jgi:protein AroM
MFNVPSAAWLLEAGALDGLERSQIDAVRPRDDEHPLVTRLASGEEVLVGKQSIVPLLQRAVERLELAGASVICVLCTGEFPTLRSTARLLFPDRILAYAVEAVLPRGVLGVLMPHEGQRLMMERKWTTAERTIVSAAVSPYDRGASFSNAIQSLERGGAELIVMDCMGFDRAMQERVRSIADVPVLLANGLTGSLLRELTGSFETAEVPSLV